jgi:hypothetical protein
MKRVENTCTGYIIYKVTQYYMYLICYTMYTILLRLVILLFHSLERANRQNCRVVICIVNLYRTSKFNTHNSTIYSIHIFAKIILFYYGLLFFHFIWPQKKEKKCGRLSVVIRVRLETRWFQYNKILMTFCTPVKVPLENFLVQKFLYWKKFTTYDGRRTTDDDVKWWQ